MSTETPRTDRMIRRRDEIAACEVVAADLARTLERELIGALTELEAITDAIGTRGGHSSVSHVIALKATIAEQAKENERLREALRGIEKALRTDSRDKSIIGDEVEYHLDGQTMYLAINAARRALGEEG